MADEVESSVQNETDSGAELTAMTRIADALEAVPAGAVRARVLRWVNERFGSATAPGPVTAGVREVLKVGKAAEIPGIARLSPEGQLQVTVRDLKAKSANDAALRLAHIIILANERLTGSASASSKGALLPNLRKYRVYDGNTRVVLARHRGLVRDGDDISLDAFSRQEAERFLREALDPAVQGTWAPGARKAAGSKKAAEGARG